MSTPRSKHHVVDADGHVSEPQDLWDTYLPSQYRRLAPRRVKDSQGHVRIMLGGELQPLLPSLNIERTERAGGSDPAARLEDMDSEGMDVAVCFTSIGLFFGGVKDPQVTDAGIRAYNDWLYDYSKTNPQRIAGVAMVPSSTLASRWRRRSARSRTWASRP